MALEAVCLRLTELRARLLLRASELDALAIDLGRRANNAHMIPNAAYNLRFYAGKFRQDAALLPTADALIAPLTRPSEEITGVICECGSRREEHRANGIWHEFTPVSAPLARMEPRQQQEKETKR